MLTHASLRGTKTTDRRELINAIKEQIIALIIPNYTEGPLIGDCFVPRNDEVETKRLNAQMSKCANEELTEVNNKR